MKYSCRVLFSLVILLSIINCEGIAQFPKKDSLFRMGELSNGMKYYLLNDPDLKGQLTINLVVNAGFYRQDKDQVEYAHLIEHLAFSQTKTYKNAKEYFARYGARFGLDMTAQTWSKNANYLMNNIPADNREYIEDCLGFFAEIHKGLSFDSAGVVKESKVLQNESRGTVDQLEEIYIDSLILNPGVQFSVGRAHDLDASMSRVNIDAVRQFYKEWYRPDNAVLFIAGDIDLAYMYDRIKFFFSGIPRPDKPLKELSYSAFNAKNQFIIGPVKALANTRIFYLQKLPNIISSNIDTYPLKIQQNILNIMLKNRYAMFEDTTGLISNLSHTNSYNNREFYSTALETRAEIKTDSGLKEGLKIILKELKKIERYGFLQEELTAAIKDYKTQLLKDYNYDSRILTGDLVNFYYGLSPFYCRKQKLDFAAAQLDKIDLNQVNALYRSYANSTFEDVMIFTSAKEAASNNWEHEFKVIKKELDSSVLDKPVIVSNILPSEYESSGLKYGNIIEKKHYDSFGVVQLTLKNGVQVFLRPLENSKNTNTQSQSKIIFRAVSAKGLLSLPRKDYFNGFFASEIAFDGGIGDVTQKEVDILKSNGLNFSFVIQDRETLIDGSIDTQHSNLLLSLIYKVFSSPTGTSKFLTEIKKNDRSLPEHADTINTLLNAMNIPVSPKMLPKDMEKLDHKRAIEIYEDFFLRSHNFSFVISGDFILDSMVMWVDKYLGNISNVGQVHPEAKLKSSKEKKAAITLRRTDKTQKAVVDVQFFDVKKIDFQSRAHLTVLYKYLESVLFSKLRFKEGLIYSGAVGFIIRRDNMYSISIHFECLPGDAVKVKAIINDELSKLRSNQVDIPLLTDQIKIAKANFIYQQNDPEFWVRIIPDLKVNNENLSVLSKFSQFADELLKKSIRKKTIDYLTENKVIEITRLPKMD